MMEVADGLSWIQLASRIRFLTTTIATLTHQEPTVSIPETGNKFIRHLLTVCITGRGPGIEVYAAATDRANNLIVAYLDPALDQSSNSPHGSPHHSRLSTSQSAHSDGSDERAEAYYLGENPRMISGSDRCASAYHIHTIPVGDVPLDEMLMASTGTSPTSLDGHLSDVLRALKDSSNKAKLFQQFIIMRCFPAITRRFSTPEAKKNLAHMDRLIQAVEDHIGEIPVPAKEINLWRHIAGLSPQHFLAHLRTLLVLVERYLDEFQVALAAESSRSAIQLQEETCSICGKLANSLDFLARMLASRVWATIFALPEIEAAVLVGKMVTEAKPSQELLEDAPDETEAQIPPVAADNGRQAPRFLRSLQKQVRHSTSARTLAESRTIHTIITNDKFRVSTIRHHCTQSIPQMVADDAVKLITDLHHEESQNHTIGNPLVDMASPNSTYSLIYEQAQQLLKKLTARTDVEARRAHVLLSTYLPTSSIETAAVKLPLQSFLAILAVSLVQKTVPPIPHCECILMAAVPDKIDGLVSSKRPCFCCQIIAQHLDFVMPDSHYLVYPWVPACGLPIQALANLEARLSSRLKDEIKRRIVEIKHPGKLIDVSRSSTLTSSTSSALGEGGMEESFKEDFEDLLLSYNKKKN